MSEKGQNYSQRINWSDYATEDQLYSSEKEFLLASLLNHDTALKLDTIKDIFNINSSNKSFQQKLGKLQFLAQIRDKLKELLANSMELQRINSFIDQQVSSLGGNKVQSINTNHALLTTNVCNKKVACSDCSSLRGPEIKSSIFDPSSHMVYAQNLATALGD